MEYEFGRVGLSIGTDIAFYIGQLNHFGFDTDFDGWALYPNISAGYRFDKFCNLVKI